MNQGGGYGDYQPSSYGGYDNPYSYSNNNEEQYYNDEYYGGQEDDYQYGGGYTNEQQQQYDQEQYGGEYNTEAAAEEVVDPNSPFYPSNQSFIPHPIDTPDSYGQYNTQGDPISAISIVNGNTSGSEGGEGEETPALMYVASHTCITRAKRSGGQQQSRRTRSKKDVTLDRGSRLTVLYNDESEHAAYGNKSMYSSFVGHAEAPPSVLNGMHSILFGGGRPIVEKNTTGSNKARPSHAYGPSFGPASFTHHSSTNLFNAITLTSSARSEDKYCMGISSIFSVTTPYLGTGGRLCSVSPNGVRVHTRGGMIMSSREDLLVGMTCGQLAAGSTSFATVCGMSYSEEESNNKRAQHVHCVDLERDIKIVSSHTLVPNASSSSDASGYMCVADMATNIERNNIVVGCSDGTIRLLDGERRNQEVAKAKAYHGGVAKVAVYENLIAASGYSSTGVSSPSSPLPYPHPASHVLIYDVRYLGRGGVTHNVFSGGPRFVDFLPDGNLLVGSGQVFGSFEIIKPFEQHASHAETQFFQPELTTGESMTTVDLFDEELYIGTSHGRVLQYGMTNREETTKHSTTAVNTEQLDMPPFVPSPPKLSIDATVLCSDANEQVIQGYDLFNRYAMASKPLISSDKSLLHPRYSRAKASATMLGPLSRPLVPPSKRWLSKKLLTELNNLPGRTTQSRGERVFPTETIGLDGLLTSDEESKGGKKMTLQNPNKLIYSKEGFVAAYDASANPRKKLNDAIDDEETIPKRYRLFVRPPFYKVTNFDYTQYNESGLFSGWDFAASFANSFACSVITMLFHVEEVRNIALQLQLCSKELSIEPGVSVTAELGLLFNLIESLVSNGMVQPSERSQVKAFVPANFISTFALLPEATNLALLDGVAGAAEIARRPEAFYRFLMQYIEKELDKLLSISRMKHLLSFQPDTATSTQGHIIDQMQGINFLSIIEYTVGKPKISTSRDLTCNLSYNTRTKVTRFGEVLRFSLNKDQRLRAWCDETRSYETVIQRKLATSLPSLLSISCCCAGKKVDTDGLQLWQQEDSRNFLPEFIEIQIETDKSITVKELATNDEGKEEWITFEQKLPLPPSFFEEWEKELPQDLPIKKSYRLDSVVSFIRSNSDVESSDTAQSEGHHIVHVRTPIDFEMKSLMDQLRQVEKCLVEKEQQSTTTNKPITLVSGISLNERAERLKEELLKLKTQRKEHKASDQWLLINGFVVTKVEADDVRSFNVKFKEPSIVLFREITDDNDAVIVDPSKELSSVLVQHDPLVPVSVMRTSSISNMSGHDTKLSSSDLQNLPSKGDLVAIDAEFVCVQQEKSLMSFTGSKEMICEARNALARLSIINCRTNEVIIDDYVLPNEPVVDHLTRFSGIRETDLDPNSSPHHLITPQEAYLKVRLLMERGCIFVGHGLSQDFRVINICIPPNQIIDTAEIYHQPNQRYISLRFLTNYVLGRDMQQEVHDSIEDAKAAYELYNKALMLKDEGKFDEYLNQVYTDGHRTQFKLGVNQDKE